jgi:ppGpp synthetase/RelA/SpoT-type nucleotidyltranferase
LTHDQSALTTSQINRLGRRIRHGDLIEPEDLDLLQDLRAMNAEAMVEVQEALHRELEVRPTSRLKTVGTILDKVKREPSMSLSRMQDIAGLRIVEEMDRIAQEEMARRVEGMYPGSKRTDRREMPSHGYRAIHVVVPVNVCWVEVQIRTRLQDLWAQLVERLGDAWGRQIRYGGDPDDPQRHLGGITRAELWDLIQDLSKRIDRSEETVAALILAEAGEVELDEDLRALDRHAIYADARNVLERIGKVVGNLPEL